jgi:hypothetical protein
MERPRRDQQQYREDTQRNQEPLGCSKLKIVAQDEDESCSLPNRSAWACLDNSVTDQQEIH